MAGLIIKLRPREELLINGVLVENGDRNTRLRIKTEGANILRVRDALRPEEATTPVKRAYYIAQLAVAGQITNVEAASILSVAIRATREFLPEVEISEYVENHDFYSVMRALRQEALADRVVNPDADSDPHPELLKKAAE
ncbi:flagellar biosynthesis repressor FlbT [Hyphococcus formosus]|uniref:flagellar biosynthesis repressor FlbT n=1 Tax=Hyphococcus formosus TaxID=3143534 RepID=UPI00398B4D45